MCVRACVCAEGARLQLSGWLQRQPGQTPCSCQPQLVEVREREKREGGTGRRADRHVLGLVRTELELKSFCLSENQRQTWSNQQQRWKLGHVGGFTCVKCDFFNPLTRPCSDPPPALSSFQKHGARTHTRACVQRPVNSVFLCSLPYTCRAPGRTGGLWVGVVFAYGVVENKPGITEIHKKEGMRDRSRSPGGWVAETSVAVSFFPLLFFT